MYPDRTPFAGLDRLCVAGRGMETRQADLVLRDPRRGGRCKARPPGGRRLEAVLVGKIDQDPRAGVARQEQGRRGFGLSGLEQVDGDLVAAVANGAGTRGCEDLDGLVREHLLEAE